MILDKNSEDSIEAEIKSLEIEIEHWTEKMDKLHEEQSVLFRCYKEKLHDFKAVNEQLCAMHDLLNEKRKLLLEEN